MATPEQSFTDDPMARAMALARNTTGTASPNPSVGAVIVKDGYLVGEGYTQPPGQAHAEIMALAQAGKEAHGADLYVTLEPCAHQGRTPPCVDAIIAAGIRRVHIAALDPNPRTDGSGVARLEQASVSVVLREGSPESFALIEAFAKHITTGIPFVVAKFAMSLDGKIATRSGDSKWISNIAARRHAHVLRAGVDAVMVGIGTALADDPQLTVRGITYAGPQPTRVIIDSTGRLPIDASMLALEGTTIVATSNIAPDKRTALETAGAVIIDTGPGIQVDLHHLLVALGEQQITSVLVEGGSHLLGSLFDLGLVDKVVSIIAPVIIGGIEAPGPVSGGGAQAMPDALRLTKVTYEQVDGDIIVTGYPPTRRT